MCYDEGVPKYFDGIWRLPVSLDEVPMCCDEVDHVELEYYDVLAQGSYGVLVHEEPMYYGVLGHGGPKYCDEQAQGRYDE